MQVIKDIDVIFGGDPELRLKQNGIWINADEHFPQGSGYAIGCDGCASTGELRIGIGNIPELIARTYNFLYWINNQGLEFFGGSFQDDHPIGGHIHVSLEGLSENSDLTTRIAANLHWVYELMSPAKDVTMRRRGGYGTAMNLREQEDNHIEFREPLAWIHAPELMMLYYSVVYLTIVNPGWNLSEGLLKEGLLTKLSNPDLVVPESIVPYFKIWDKIIDKVMEVNYEIPGNYYWGLASSIHLGEVFK